MLSLFVIRQKSRMTKSWKYVRLLSSHIFFLATSIVMLGYVVEQAGPMSSWPVIFGYIGGQTTGAAALVFKPVRQAFRRSAPKIGRFWWVFIVGEGSYVASLVCSGYSMNALHPAIAMAIGGTYPVMILMAGPFLRRLGASEAAFPEEQAMWKKGLVLAMNAIGLALLAQYQTGQSTTILG
jgi:hypothetical protein